MSNPRILQLPASRQGSDSSSKRRTLLIACLLLVISSQTTTTSALNPSNNNVNNKRVQQPQSQGGRSFQNRSPMKMSEASIVFSDFADDNEVVAGMSRVRERLSDQLQMRKNENNNGGSPPRKQKYKRKRIPETEKEKHRLKLTRQAEYRQVVEEARADGSITPNIFSFESLFPDPVLDQKSIKSDLYSTKERDQKTRAKAAINGPKNVRANVGPLLSNANKPEGAILEDSKVLQFFNEPELQDSRANSNNNADANPLAYADPTADSIGVDTQAQNSAVDALGLLVTPPQAPRNATAGPPRLINGKVDRSLTRMVEDKMFGYRRTPVGQFQYETSLMGDGAIKFRDGVRLGNPLSVNADRLTYMAKKELQKGRVEEAKELYEQTVEMDQRDGRGYLGLSKCAERRRDFKLARDWLRAGIQNSVATETGSTANIPDKGGNPFLLQALGRLEEKRGHLVAAESLYVQAARSRPSHAAAWVSLAQLRTRKLGQTVAAGRVCYETAQRELRKAGKPQNSHVYTAWASLEYKGAGDVRRARQLFENAIKIDPKCSAAWLQLGVMEADNELWDEAQNCFETVLKFDQRNSRVMQAYALMETRRPDGSSRKAINMFERALKVNSRDAGVLQPYALYVAELGDLEAARELLRRGTEVSKRHAPVWQAWGVLEMRHGYPEEGRKIFQEGIWACAQLAGNQSGGYHCARLWQAWGVLESREGDYAAARRCFSRALDADGRNVATVTAWTQMEEEIGNSKDARALFERYLKKFSPGCDAKMVMWRAYELMEQRADNIDAAQQVYQRSVRESFNIQEDHSFVIDDSETKSVPEQKPKRKKDEEIEQFRWDGQTSSMKGEIWMNDGSIEAQVPEEAMKKQKRKQKQNLE